MNSEIERMLTGAASVAYTEISNLAQDLTLPADEYPLAQIIETLDDEVCPLCEWLHGKIIRRGTPEWEQYRLPSHINCRRTFAYIPADSEEEADFEPPPASLLQKHGHFHVDPLRYEELRVPVFADRRQFVFRRVRDEETGGLRGVLVWFVEPFDIPTLKPGTVQIPGVGAGYLGKVRSVLERAPVKPSEEEVRRAMEVLSKPPVAGYPPFRESEVRAIGAYILSAGRGSDSFWREIVEGRSLAWAIAVHEAAELHAFEAILNVDWTNAELYKALLGEAHLYALAQELRFLREWAKQEGFNVPESALETEHPVRRYFHGHQQFVELLVERMGWSLPSRGQRQAARRFWSKILGR